MLYMSLFLLLISFVIAILKERIPYSEYISYGLIIIAFLLVVLF